MAVWGTSDVSRIIHLRGTLEKSETKCQVIHGRLSFMDILSPKNKTQIPRQTLSTTLEQNQREKMSSQTSKVSPPCTSFSLYPYLSLPINYTSSIPSAL